MAVRALAGNGEKIASTETYVSSNLAFRVQVYLPPVKDGTGGTIALGKEIRFEALNGGTIEVLTEKGRRVGIVIGKNKACAVAQSGQNEGDHDQWVMEPVRSALSTFQTISASPTQAEVTALRNCLVAAGLMKAE